MGHHEKQSIVSIIGSVLVIGFYSLYVYRNYIQADMDLLNDFQFWGKSFLYLIPVAIVLQIVIHIIFAIADRIITQEDMPDITDERDKLIELKSIRISHWIFILGFMLAMGSLAMGMKPYVMFLTLISSGFIASLASEVAKIIYYRKGA
ncbi:MAG: hypothetical protein MUC78_13565 [Bacteroidales bacterium]|jgi:hypothetical protein|nr:hypothetical protein [Bacteroidales bacterium]